MNTKALLPMSSDSFSEIHLKITLCIVFLHLGSACGTETQVHVVACYNMSYHGFLAEFHKLIMLKINKCYNSDICLE